MGEFDLVTSAFIQLILYVCIRDARAGVVHLFKTAPFTFFLNASINKLSWNVSQDATLQHYMDYSAENLIPVMAHIAKNVVKVNEGLTKHTVSLIQPTSSQVQHTFEVYSSSAANKPVKLELSLFVMCTFCSPFTGD